MQTFKPVQTGYGDCQEPNRKEPSTSIEQIVHQLLDGEDVWYSKRFFVSFDDVVSEIYNLNDSKKFDNALRLIAHGGRGYEPELQEIITKAAKQVARRIENDLERFIEQSKREDAE